MVWTKGHRCSQPAAADSLESLVVFRQRSTWSARLAELLMESRRLRIQQMSAQGRDGRLINKSTENSRGRHLSGLKFESLESANNKQRSDPCRYDGTYPLRSCSICTPSDRSQVSPCVLDIFARYHYEVANLFEEPVNCVVIRALRRSCSAPKCCDKVVFFRPQAPPCRCSMNNLYLSYS